MGNILNREGSEMNTRKLLVLAFFSTLATPAISQSFSLPLPPISAAERTFALESSGNELSDEEAVRVAQLSYLRQIESICGTEDFQDVELYDGTLGVDQDFVTSHQSPTGLLQWKDDLADRYGDGAGNVNGARWCTGTLIAENIMLTAGHCFDPSDDPFGWRTPARLVDGVKVLVDAEELATDIIVNFGYQIATETNTLREPEVFPITKLMEYRIDDLDYAILELGRGSSGEYPGTSYSYLQTDSGGISAGDILTVIQHPAGQPKKIEAGTETEISEPFIFYGDIDTLGGSSGSSVLNADGKIVGVHTNGGCQATSGENRSLTIRRIAQSSGYLK